MVRVQLPNMKRQLASIGMSRSACMAPRREPPWPTTKTDSSKWLALISPMTPPMRTLTARVLSPPSGA